MNLLNEALNSPYCIFSIVGPHAGETLESIFSRKINDLHQSPFTFWACKIKISNIQTIGNKVDMLPIVFLQPLNLGGARDTQGNNKAEFYSEDRINWIPMPNISPVTGNFKKGVRALKLDTLYIRYDNTTIDLNDYNNYSTNNVIKLNNFCSTVTAYKNSTRNNTPNSIRTIAAVGKLAYPYCVYIK